MEQYEPHIRCSRDTNVKYAIVPGDPKRVDRVKEFLEEAKEIANNREYKSVVGYYKGVKVLVTSTGIGGPSTGIAVEELKNIGIDTIIRIGSCGALQDNIKLGDLIIGIAAVRDEGTSKTYIETEYPAVADIEVVQNLIESAKEQKFVYHHGVIRSHDSFYTDEEENIDKYWEGKNVLGADMESAALFVIGRLRNIKTASILNVVVESDGNLENGINEYVDGDNNSMDGEKKEILTALEGIVKLNNKKIL